MPKPFFELPAFAADQYEQTVQYFSDYWNTAGRPDISTQTQLQDFLEKAFRKPKTMQANRPLVKKLVALAETSGFTVDLRKKAATKKALTRLKDRTAVELKASAKAMKRPAPTQADIKKAQQTAQLRFLATAASKKKFGRVKWKTKTDKKINIMFSWVDWQTASERARTGKILYVSKRNLASLKTAKQVAAFKRMKKK